jgi:hypothetical protein
LAEHAGDHVELAADAGASGWANTVRIAAAAISAQLRVDGTRVLEPAAGERAEREHAHPVSSRRRLMP